MKKVYEIFVVFLIILTLCSPISILARNVSIHPILTLREYDINETIEITSDEELLLSWIVIDDNPRNYFLFINNVAWKSDKIFSGEINTTFSDIEGTYEIFIVVFDYSNNSVSQNITINVSSSVTDYPSATGFGFTTTTIIIIFIALIPVIIRRKRMFND